MSNVFPQTVFGGFQEAPFQEAPLVRMVELRDFILAIFEHVGRPQQARAPGKIVNGDGGALLELR